MYYKIENELFTAEIDDMGAQLHSLKSKKTGAEFLWQGDESIWYGQAPVLFPFIGQLIDNKFRYNGVEYSMQKHGFARKLPFKVRSVDGARAVFYLESDIETLKKYPFEFELEEIFELKGGALINTAIVRNKTAGEMYFSYGAHPGFNCEIGDTIEFELPETLETEQIDSENLVIKEKFPVLNNEREITITANIFDKDALILSGIKSDSLKIKSPRLNRELKFNFGSCPLLGIWAKPGAPYVCIEPWYGVGDNHDVKADVSQKRAIERLNEGESFEYTWSAEPIEY